MNGTSDGASQRRSMVDRVRERPLVATLIVLLPVFVAAYVQLVTGLANVEDKNAELEDKSAELEDEKAGIEGKAGKLEQATIKTSAELAGELERLRQAAASELAALYSEQADVRESIETLRERLALVEDTCLDEETLLRARARERFPGANVDGMEAGVLRRLLGLVVPGESSAADAMGAGGAATVTVKSEKRGKIPDALANPIELAPQAPIFDGE